jgi:hypothetical protein
MMLAEREDWTAFRTLEGLCRKADQFNDRVRRHIRDSYEAEALAAARIDERVDQAMAARSERMAGVVAGLPDRVSEELRNHPRQRWVDVVEKLAATVAEETDRDLKPAEE